MLLHLEIQNIALIDRVSIDLGNKFNILTGETGAGKSIIIDSINAILGERVSKDLIRTGKDKAVVEAVFQVDNERLASVYESLGLIPEEDGTLIVSREFTLSGRNICRINGKMVTVSMLKELGELIIDIHGQYDNQSLLRTESHIELLDAFAGERINTLKKEYLKFLDEYKSVRTKLKNLRGDKNERERKIDLLGYQVDEIKKAKLKSGEEEELNRQRLLLANSEKVAEALNSAYELLFQNNSLKSSASDSINEAVAELGSIAKLDSKFSDVVQKLEEVSYQLEDIVETIRKEKDSVEYSPEALEQIEERLDLIFKLKRKYGNSIDEVLKYCRNTQTELDEIIRSEETINNLEDQSKQLSDKLMDISLMLNSERKSAAKILETSIGEELNELEMKNARFKVSIDFDQMTDTNGNRKFSANGLDKIEFLISPNEGEPLKPLSKIASGGEMSRVMLAIKTILADVDRVPTLIFDEIDIGISGKAAQKVGEKLSYISRKHQVICVTHLAQIACMADEHHLIEKISEEGSTKTLVNKLADREIHTEIARLLSGANISDITIQHAKEMLENAHKFKNN